jgi:hypothetical protein
MQITISIQFFKHPFLFQVPCHFKAFFAVWIFSHFTPLWGLSSIGKFWGFRDNFGLSLVGSNNQNEISCQQPIHNIKGEHINLPPAFRRSLRCIPSRLNDEVPSRLRPCDEPPSRSRPTRAWRTVPAAAERTRKTVSPRTTWMSLRWKRWAGWRSLVFNEAE